MSLEESTDRPAAVPENSSQALYFTVCDPSRVTQEGLLNTHHWEYRIEVRKSPEHAPFIETSRRYKEFAALRDHLEESSPGVIVPPLPAKAISATFEKIPMGVNVDRLVAFRQRQLEKFLNKCAQHDILRNDKALAVFVESQNLDREPIFKDKKPSLEKQYGVGMSMKSMLAKIKPKGKAAAEPSFLEVVADYSERYETLFDEWRVKADGLYRIEKELGSRYRDVGDVSGRCSQLDRGKKTDELITADALEDFSTRALQLSTVFQGAEEFEVLDRLSFYVEAFRSIRRTIKRLQEYETLLALAEDETLSTREKINQASSKGGKDDGKLAKLQEDLQRMESRENQIRQEYEAAVSRFRKEWDGFLSTKASDIKTLLKRFVQTQCEIVRKMEDVWDGLNNTLDAIPDN